MKTLMFLALLSFGACGSVSEVAPPDLASAQPPGPVVTIQRADQGPAYAPSGQRTAFLVQGVGVNLLNWNRTSGPDCAPDKVYINFQGTSATSGTLIVIAKSGLTSVTHCGPMTLYGSNGFPAVTINPTFDVGP